MKRLFPFVFVLSLVLLVSPTAKATTAKDSQNCGCSDCFLISDQRFCLPAISRQSCFYDEANGTYLLFRLVADKGKCEPFGFPGQEGKWYQRLQWNSKCNGCCPNPGGGKKFNFEPEDIGLLDQTIRN